jgi:hypothetical protein
MIREYRTLSTAPETAEGVSLIAAHLAGDANVAPYLVGSGTIETNEAAAPADNDPKIWIVVREPWTFSIDSSVKTIEAPYEVVVRSTHPADPAYSPYNSMLAAHAAVYRSIVGRYLNFTRALQKAPVRRSQAPTRAEYFEEDNYYESIAVFRALLVPTP